MSAFTSADLKYLLANYFTLDELRAGRGIHEHGPSDLLPAPSYVLDDGIELFPADYFVFPDQVGDPGCLQEHFTSRYVSAGGNPAEMDADWTAYLDGVYGVCLRQVLPETIVRKGVLVESLTSLLAAPQPESAEWRARLRRETWELDALEREFSPDYDRSGRFGRPPTRDLLIGAARRRYPALVA